MDATKIYAEVNKHYGSIAETSVTSTSAAQAIAKSFGYSEEELLGAPDGTNLGLSCGNPLVLARLNEGETVIDFGSGAGFDVFMAAEKVGPTGRVIGVDMNKAMLEKANGIKARSGVHNVEFVESAITDIKLPDSTADCIISNCVVNLVPAAERQSVFDEAYRLLKPGGRLAVSDTLVRKPLSEEMRSNIALYVGCIAGAGFAGEYDGCLRKAGFRDVLIVDAQHDLNVYLTGAECCIANQPAGEQNMSSCSIRDAESCQAQNGPCGCNEQVGGGQLNIARLDLNEWAGSFKVYAVK